MRTLAIALLLATTSCSANSVVSSVLQNAPVIGTVCAAADKTLVDEKVVYASEVLYNIPAHAYVTADKNGQFKDYPAAKAKAKELLIKLDVLRNAIFHAKGAVTCDFAEMKKVQVEILQLIPRK